METNQVIICKPVLELKDPVLDQVEKTYNDSFPEAERRAFSLVRTLLREDTRFRIYTLFRDEAYVGFITAWQFEGFVYAEHFAIDETARNGGIGGKAMKGFLARHEDPIVLEVEMPTEEMSKRRVGFYERLGFVLDHHTYFQPPYRQGEDWLEMRLMTHGDIDMEESFENIKTVIHENVYGVR